MALKDCSISFTGFIEKLYKRLGMGQNDIELKVSYLPCIACDKLLSITLRGDECLVIFMIVERTNT